MMKYLKMFNEGILGNMMGIERKGSPSRWYRYLGEVNGSEWKENVGKIVSQKEPQYLPDEDIENITEILRDHLSLLDWKRDIEYSDYHPVQYPLLKKVQMCTGANSRFGNCWFLNPLTDSDYIDVSLKTFLSYPAGYPPRVRLDTPEWDISFQYYPDETYLVYVGDGRGRFSYHFECDTFYGVQMFLREQIKKY